MNTVVTSLTSFQSSHSSARQSALSTEVLRERVPAAFAPAAHERTSAAYTFISTERVLNALASAGFLPVEGRQAARAKSPLHARHLIRLRRRFETIALRDAIPEILFLNSHDGTSAYQLRVGLFRVVCTNGLVVSAASFPPGGSRIPRRRRAPTSCLQAALQISERFRGPPGGRRGGRMEHTPLDAGCSSSTSQREAVALRFPGRTARRDCDRALSDSWYPAGPKMSAMTSGARSTCIRRTSSAE